MTVPTWRRDVEGPADLVEEVARIEGYDKVPSTPLEARSRRGEADRNAIAADGAARSPHGGRAWAGRGGDVELHFGRARPTHSAARDWRLANPISEDMKVMRPVAPARPDCGRSAQLDRGATSVRLFEVGRRYLGDAEHPTLSLLLAGERHGARNGGPARREPFDAFDVKAEVARPARRGRRAGREPSGLPRCRARPGIPGGRPGSGSAPRPSSPASASSTRGCSKSSTRPPARSPRKSISTRSRRRARPIVPASRYAPPALQAITRDFAFIVPDDLPADNLLRAIRGADKVAITDVRLFDRFEAPDGLSLAFEVTLQPVEKSFTDEQIGEMSRRIVAAAEKLGARLRGYQRVDRGVDTCLDLLALQAGGDDFADLERDRSRLVDEPPAPQASAVHCDRDDRQAERAIERRRSPSAAAASSPTGTRVPSGKDHHRPAGLDRFLALPRPAPGAPSRPPSARPE